MRKRLLFLFAVAMLASTSGATTLARMNLEQLGTAATVIVRARCMGSFSDWEGGEIWTLTRFQTLERFKGALPAGFTVRLIGGQVGGIESIVSEVPRFRPGEEVVLFLDPTNGGDYTVTAWVEGTFRVRRDGAGRAFVTEESASQVVYDRATRKFRVEGIRRMPLGQFRQRIQSVVKGNRPAGLPAPSAPARKPRQ
ncbi:MAG TPA: hypothetical protein VNJ12_08775 [Candidatus Dormibacteraeota bacterium]|nr:hypothetical protein [Candidatus Dormibacteraeota bacterium]